MREIKFRAWDGEKMTSQIELHFAHGLRLVSTSDLGFGMIGDDKCVLMQYTGLKDKTGKEIYEDDLIKDGKLIRAVQYFPEWGAFQLVEGGGNCVNLIKGEDQEGGLEDYLVAEKIKVIGNIYENPNLL